MMAKGLPLIFSEAEIERLHGIAYASAIQTGAKGNALDGLTAELFTSLAKHANIAEMNARRKPALLLVE